MMKRIFFFKMKTSILVVPFSQAILDILNKHPKQGKKRLRANRTLYISKFMRKTILRRSYQENP